jgi:hypothetical protein
MSIAARLPMRVSTFVPFIVSPLRPRHVVKSRAGVCPKPRVANVSGPQALRRLVLSR